MLTALEKSEPKPIDSVVDEITAERARVLMELDRPTEVAELLMKSRQATATLGRIVVSSNACVNRITRSDAGKTTRDLSRAAG